MNFFTGKHAKHNDHKYRTLQFGDYVPPGLPEPPAASGNLARAYQSLGTTDATEVFPIDGNDVEGCCAIAGVAHFTTVFNAFVGRKVIPAAADVHALYRLLTGGGDTGLNLLSVMNYLRQNGYLGEKAIFAFVEVNPANLIHVKQAINWFGGLYTGMQVQANAQSDFLNGKPWQPGRLTHDGHLVISADYDETGLKELTWGNVEPATWPWEKQCCDEMYALLPQEAQDPSFCPGFDFAHLQADLQAVTN
jgi:hypothetical protein